MKKSTIQKTVDEVNAKNLAQYEASVAAATSNIKLAQDNIVTLEKIFAKNVAEQAVNIGQQRKFIAGLTPPATVTAVEIFGPELVEAATE